MTAVPLGDLDLVGCLEHRNNGDLLRLDKGILVVLCIKILNYGFNHLKLDSSLCSRKHYAIALPRRESIERIRHLHTVGVFYKNVHSVLDANTVTENALVAEVSVVLLAIVVKHLIAANGNVSRKGIALGILAIGGTVIELGDSSLLCVLASVELEVTQSEDLGGVGIYPEIDKVKVVGRLMHHKSATVSLISVPTAEIVCAVRGIKKPFEVDLLDVSDNTVHNKLTHLGLVGSVSVVEGHAEVSACSFDAIDDLLTLVGIHCHRLFGNDVTAHFHSLDDVSVVGTVDRGDDDHVGLGLLDHLFKLVCAVSGDLMVSQLLNQTLVSIVHAAAVNVAESHKLCVFVKISCNCSIVKDGSAAYTNLRISFLFHIAISLLMNFYKYIIRQKIPFFLNFFDLLTQHLPFFLCFFDYFSIPNKKNNFEIQILIYL